MPFWKALAYWGRGSTPNPSEMSALMRVSGQRYTRSHGAHSVRYCTSDPVPSCWPTGTTSSPVPTASSHPLLCLYSKTRLNCLRFHFIGVRYFELRTDPTSFGGTQVQTFLSARFEVFTAAAMKNVIHWDIKTQFIPNRRHITSPLQIPTS
jgi:hypothetical protein